MLYPISFRIPAEYLPNFKGHIDQIIKKNKSMY